MPDVVFKSLLGFLIILISAAIILGDMRCYILMRLIRLWTKTAIGKIKEKIGRGGKNE